MYDAWLDTHIDYCDPDEPQEDEWADSAENEPPADKFVERDGSRLEKKRGKCVVEVAHDGVKWDV